MEEKGKMAVGGKPRCGKKYQWSASLKKRPIVVKERGGM